jgi:hypothetical protein
VQLSLLWTIKLRRTDDVWEEQRLQSKVISNEHWVISNQQSAISTQQPTWTAVGPFQQQLTFGLWMASVRKLILYGLWRQAARQKEDKQRRLASHLPFRPSQTITDHPRREKEIIPEPLACCGLVRAEGRLPPQITSYQHVVNIAKSSDWHKHNTTQATTASYPILSFSLLSSPGQE